MDYARLTLSTYIGVETTTGDDVKVMTISQEMTSLSCSPAPESLTGDSVVNSTCAKYLCADLEGEANSLCVKQLDECSLKTLPSDADPRYFYVTANRPVDGCIRFQSTTNKHHYLAFDGHQLYLKHTMDDGDEETYFKRFSDFATDSCRVTQLPSELQQQQ
jgi:hypothetical protein